MRLPQGTPKKSAKWYRLVGVAPSSFAHRRCDRAVKNFALLLQRTDGYNNIAMPTDPNRDNPTTANVIDIEIAQPLTYGVFLVMGRMLITLLLIGVGAGVAANYLSGTRRLSMNITMIMVMLLIVAWVLGWGWLCRRWAKRMVAHTTCGDWSSDLTATIESVLQEARRIQPMAALHELLRRAGESGVHNVALRICQPRHSAPLSPIDVPFEPQPLDATDPTLRHLVGDANGAHDDATDPMWRRIKRNIYVKGGWLIAGIFALNVVIHAAQSWQLGRITWDLIMWSALLFGVLLIPTGGSSSARRQLLAVPGGLLYRRVRRGAERWDVRLFVRQRSVACVYQSGRRQWMIVVADEEQTAKCAGTKTEVEFALRAWLSPLEPPSIERMSEFT